LAIIFLSFLLGKRGELMENVDVKCVVKSIIERLTHDTKSIFSERIFLEAGELGIGESYVRQALEKLKEERYLESFFDDRLIRRL